MHGHVQEAAQVARVQRAGQEAAAEKVREDSCSPAKRDGTKIPAWLGMTFVVKIGEYQGLHFKARHEGESGSGLELLLFPGRI